MSEPATIAYRQVGQPEPLVFDQSLAEHYRDEKRLKDWWRTAVVEGRTGLRLMPQHIQTMGFPDVELPRVRTRFSGSF